MLFTTHRGPNTQLTYPSSRTQPHPFDRKVGWIPSESNAYCSFRFGPHHGGALQKATPRMRPVISNNLTANNSYYHERTKHHAHYLSLFYPLNLIALDAAGECSWKASVAHSSRLRKRKNSFWTPRARWSVCMHCISSAYLSLIYGRAAHTPLTVLLYNRLCLLVLRLC